MNPTFSSLERGEACPASHVLPRVLVTHEWTEVGIEIHDFLRLVAPDPAFTSRALARIADDELRARCAAIDLPTALDRLMNVRAECAYAIDLETASVRFLGHNLERAYTNLAPNEIAGTLDVDADHVDRTPTAGDWKSGFSELTPAEDNLQIGVGAYAVAKARGADRAIGRLWFIGQDGRIRTDEAEFDALDLEHVLDRTRHTVRRIREAEARYSAGETLTVHRGPWCTYCPARPHCPAMIAFAREMLPALEQDRAALEMLLPDQLGEVWERARLAAKIAEEVIDSLKKFAATHPIPLPDGRKEVRSHQGSTTWVNGHRALEMLRERGANDEELAPLIGTTRYPVFSAKLRPGVGRRKASKTKPAEVDGHG
ncbi:PD-(D/E)XK nuclease family protein [Pendulispora albinea]|uniref:PD-(D/E)XK nuclease family protein n=1 Tax=Pendulispora albinea TaxID=2741071 RepID=A0ABZ2M0L6_9BACT